MPPLLLLGLPALAALKDYRPVPIGRHDLVHFFADRRNQAAQIYLMGGAASHILQQTVIPLAAVTVLGAAVNVGGFNTVFAIAGALALLAVGAAAVRKTASRYSASVQPSLSRSISCSAFR